MQETIPKIGGSLEKWRQNHGVLRWPKSGGNERYIALQEFGILCIPSCMINRKEGIHLETKPVIDCGHWRDEISLKL